MRPFRRPDRRWLAPLLFAVCAYLPALTARPGRMPADTKLYLYLDPGRLISDAPYTFDGRQFAGWVPHQTISYLWPSGPWYWLFDRLGVPDWVAHRLWIGTILFLAGTGVWWAAKVLGIGFAGAVAAGVVYELSPYVLPYLSRTSLMLLPFAGLGWLVGLTVRAATGSRWRHIALFALVVATVGAPNATAIAMIAPAPLLWLANAAWNRAITWRRAGITAARIGGASIAVSLWWLAMLSVQSKVGADVLAYSETVEAVSLTATSTETLRGMGYWLFYVRDPVGFTTSAVLPYLSSTKHVLVSFLVPLIGLTGLALVRFAARRFAVLLVLVGIVLAVGVHPIDDPSPLMSPFADSSRSTFVLALRSSTRALPLSVLGLALGAGALVSALGLDRVRLRAAATGVVVLLAVINVPAMRGGGFVDPVISRDQEPPQAWRDAAVDLDALPAGGRVLQLPGQEFGAFRWGYTADPPLPGLTARPLITRDLLPLGSAVAMDLVYALDDRFQIGVAEADSIAPVARLLGADRIWVTNDAWFDRFRTPRPELVAELFTGDVVGLGDPVRYGSATPNEPALASIDERSISDPSIGTALEPVWLVPVDDVPGIVRAKTTSVWLAGSGDGIVDAAAAGLLDGSELVLYTGLAPAAGTDATRVIVTDSNRDRAHHWRGSQDVSGFTESGGPGSDVLRFDSADQRLPALPDDAAVQTVSEQRGQVTVRASAYGEPFAYRPEDRAAMAVDGNPATAWVVADRGQPVGEYLELTADGAVTAMTLVQPDALATGTAPDRWITALDVSVDGGRAQRVELTEAARRATGQRIELPAAGHVVRLTIAAVTPGRDAVGLAEVDAGLGPTSEVIRVPIDWLDRAGDLPIDVVLTRLRTDPTNRWRSDPEPALVRSVELPRVVEATLGVEARLDRRATDTVLAELFDAADMATADSRLTGVPAAGGWAAFDGDPSTAWVTPFGRPVGPGVTIPRSAAGIEPATDRITITQPADAEHSLITAVTVSDGAGAEQVAVPAPDADGVSTLTLGTPLAGDRVTIAVAAVDARTTRDRRSAEEWVLPAAISEIDLGGGPASMPPTFDTGCREDLLQIDGVPVPLRVSGEVASAISGEPLLVAPCNGDPVRLGAGEHLIESTPGLGTGIDIDRVVLSDGARDLASRSLVDVAVTQSSRLARRIEVGQCDGCWLVLGEGYNTGWKASVDGKSLGEPQPIDGGFTGWWLPASDSARTVDVHWTEQRRVTVSLWLSMLAVLACVVVAFADRRAAEVRPPRPPRWAGLGQPRRVAPWQPALLCGALATIVISPQWGIVGALAGAAAGLLRRPRLLGLAALALATANAAYVTARVWRRHPFADAGWPPSFDRLHRPGLFVLVLLVGSLLAADRSREPAESGDPR